MRYISFLTKILSGVGLVCLVSSCGSRDNSLETAPFIVARAKLGQELLFVDRTDGIVHAVNVMKKTLSSSAERIDIPANPLVAMERPGTSEVLVLCGGARDANDEWTENPALAVIDSQHVVRIYELSMPLSTIETTADGRYALLYAPNTGAVSGDLLSNPNRVALIDLDHAPSFNDVEPSSNNPVERTLKAPGGALQTVTLTEPMNIVGEQRPIALFTFPDGISVWDLSHAERAEITSEGLASGGSVTLKRSVIDAANGTIYLIQNGLTDLRVLDLNNAATSKDNDFWPSWNQLPLDSLNASDLVLYTEQDEPRVLVAVGSEVRIIDSNDSRVVPIVVAKPVTQFYGFTGVAPNDPDVKARVLGWAPGQTAVTFIEFQDLESRGSRNMEVLELGKALAGVLPLSDTRLLTEFDYGGIGVLDLESRRFTPLTSSVELAAPLIESDAARVWVGSTGDVRVGYFDPSTLKTGEIRLDSAIEEMFLFEDDTERKIVISHNDPLGQVTVVDTKQPTRSKATVLDGFLLDGLVKR